MKEKTYVEEIDRSMYDFRNEEKDAYKVKKGLQRCNGRLCFWLFLFICYTVYDFLIYKNRIEMFIILKKMLKNKQIIHGKYWRNSRHMIEK